MWNFYRRVENIITIDNNKKNYVEFSLTALHGRRILAIFETEVLCSGRGTVRGEVGRQLVHAEKSTIILVLTLHLRALGTQLLRLVFHNFSSTGFLRRPNLILITRTKNMNQSIFGRSSFMIFFFSKFDYVYLNVWWRRKFAWMSYYYSFVGEGGNDFSQFTMSPSILTGIFLKTGSDETTGAGPWLSGAALRSVINPAGGAGLAISTLWPTNSCDENADCAAS